MYINVAYVTIATVINPCTLSLLSCVAAAAASIFNLNTVASVVYPEYVFVYH